MKSFKIFASYRIYCYLCKLSRRVCPFINLGSACFLEIKCSFGAWQKSDSVEFLEPCGMEDIITGSNSKRFSPHKGGLNNVGVSPYQCPLNPMGSQSHTHDNDMSGTEGTVLPELNTFRKTALEYKWYIVLFSKPHQEIKFRNFVLDHPEYTKSILEVYCPTHTVVMEYYQKLEGGKPSKQLKTIKGKKGNIPYKDKPLFGGSDFVYATYQALSEFLKVYYTCGSIQFKKKSREENKSEPLTVPEDQMEEFRNFNENYVDKTVMLQHPFEDYAYNVNENKPNETLKIVDGPMAGLTGYFIKIAKNRGLAFKVNNPYGGTPYTFAIPNIWDYHVVRLHNADNDNQTLATLKPRAVDLLIGILQGCGYDDNSILDELNLIIGQLTRNKSLSSIASGLLIQRRESLNHANVTKLRAEETLSNADKELNDIKGKADDSKNKKKELRKQKREADKIITTLEPRIRAKEIQLEYTRNLVKKIKNVTADDVRLILNLVRYEKDAPGYVKDSCQHLTLRPFLTPTSGIELLEGKDYGILQHKEFAEIIKKVTITEECFFPKSGKSETITGVYYAHVGIKKDNGKDVIVFVNWNEFLSKYYLTDIEGRKRLANVVESNNADGKTVRTSYGTFSLYAPTLCYVLTNQDLPISAIQSMQVGEDSSMNVLAIKLHNISLSTDEKLENNKTVLNTVDALINKGIAICKEINSSSHIAAWRGLLSTVWLHN